MFRHGADPFWARLDGAVFRTAEDKQIQLRLAITDVTQQRLAKEALRESHDQLREAIDELKRTQEQVIRQERLRALGEMASGIGHDLNNTLTPILGYSEMLRLEPELPETAREYLKWIETGARDAVAVVARVRKFHQEEHTTERHEPLRVAELLTDVAALTRPKWRDEAHRTGRDIELDLQLDDVPPVLGHPAELREVLTNLVLNAVDALPKGGRITLQLRRTHEAVVIEVVDTGVGMAADVRVKCFEPFFSTKGLDGTGLGLSVCHGIVERHGGRFEVDSAPGHGTTFAIHLPIAAETPSDEPHEPEPPLPSRRVLYIDDDPRLRVVIAEMLGRLGQQVDVAEGGEKGFEMFHANDYDVVVTDLGMPNVDGTMVTRIIKTTQSKKPVIMLTGWASGPESQLPSEAPDVVLSKPVTIRQLREALEKVLP